MILSREELAYAGAAVLLDESGTGWWHFGPWRLVYAKNVVGLWFKKVYGSCDCMISPTHRVLEDYM